MKWPDPRAKAKLVQVMVWAHEYMDGDKAAIKETVDYMAEQVLLEFPDHMSVATPTVITPLRVEYNVMITHTYPKPNSSEVHTWDGPMGGRILNREEALGLVKADLEAHPDSGRNPRLVHRMVTDWVVEE